MKSAVGYPRILIGILVLVLAQLACSIGAQPTGTGPLQPPTSGVLATELPTVEVLATQPSLTTLSVRGTPDEAKAMLQKAVEHYNSVGRKQALADFTGRVAPFFDRDLYVACIDSKLTQSANGGFPDLVGSTIEPISRTAWDSATETKIDSVDYQWLNPATGVTEPKTFYYEKVGTDVCGVGAYHP